MMNSNSSTTGSGLPMTHLGQCPFLYNMGALLGMAVTKLSELLSVMHLGSAQYIGFGAD